MHPFDLTRFIENPLLPKEIADHLSPFINIYLHRQDNNQDIEPSNNILVFNESKNRLPDEVQPEQLYKTTAHSLKQNKDFMQAINELDYAIKTWCKSNNLEDLNFRKVNSRMIY